MRVFIILLSAPIYTLVPDSNTPPWTTTVDNRGLWAAQDSNSGSLRTLIFKFELLGGNPFYLYYYVSTRIPIAICSTTSGIYVLNRLTSSVKATIVYVSSL